MPTVCPIAPVAAEVLVPQLGATDRFWTRPGKEMKIGAPVVWDDGPPWEVWLEVRDEPSGEVALGATLRRGTERLAGGAPPVVLGESGFLLAGDHLARVAEGARAGRRCSIPRTPCASPPASATSCWGAC